jgi:hypothetical protein
MFGPWFSRIRTAGGRWGCAALLLVGLAGAAHAQGIDLTGSWRGQAMGVTFTLVVTPDQRFSQQQINGTLMTAQQGRIVPAGPGMVSFVVEAWSPQTMPVYHPTGTVGGYYTQEPTSPPPGGTWQVTFTSPDAMIMHDVQMGGSITMLRVH